MSPASPVVGVETDPAPEARRDLHVAAHPRVVALHHDLAGQHGELERAVVTGVAGVPPLPDQVAPGEISRDLVAERPGPPLTARLWRVIHGPDAAIGPCGDMGDVSMEPLLASVAELVAGHPRAGQRLDGEGGRHRGEQRHGHTRHALQDGGAREQRVTRRGLPGFPPPDCRLVGRPPSSAVR